MDITVNFNLRYMLRKMASLQRGCEARAARAARA
jgi:hypothetical protein